MIPRGSQTPINTGQKRTSNRFRTRRNENREQRRPNQTNFNKFLGLLKDFLEVCLFVVALVMTAKLVGMILEEQRPELIAAVRGTASRWRGILLFSFKYMVIQGLLVEVPLFLGATLLTSARFSEFALSKSLVFTFGLVAEGVLAWLL